MPTQAERWLQRSRKFQRWQPSLYRNKVSGQFEPNVTEHYFTPVDLAKRWGVSPQTIRNIFREELGVLKIRKSGKLKRQYTTLRIPREVAGRVHRRLSA